MYNLHYHIYQLPQPNIHEKGWYSFCLFNDTSGKSALLLLDASSVETPAGLNEGIVFSVQEDQLPNQVRESLKKYPLFYQNGHGPFPLGTTQQTDIRKLFEKIGSQIDTSYIYKDYLLANFALHLIHFGIKHFAAAATV
jgi:hypothetical protein